MVQVRSARVFSWSTIKDRMLTQARPFRKGADREQPLIFACNAGIRAYNYTGLMASQWQMLNL
jgi:hypothetical protein